MLVAMMRKAIARQSRLQYASSSITSQLPRHLTSTPKAYVYGARVRSKKETMVDPYVVATKRHNVPQSPWKMRFLVMLMRGAWFPDAVAQMKFSPKHRATDMNQLLSNAYNMARIKYDAIPEGLMVKEVFVTKGIHRKRMRIMGRGRTGFGYQRSSHVFVKLTKVDFPEKIKKGNLKDKKEWKKRYNLVKKLKLVGGASVGAEAKRSSAGVEAKQ